VLLEEHPQALKEKKAREKKKSGAVAARMEPGCTDSCGFTGALCFGRVKPPRAGGKENS
jgi:hypothetical protein